MECTYFSYSREQVCRLCRDEPYEVDHDFDSYTMVKNDLSDWQVLTQSAASKVGGTAAAFRGELVNNGGEALPVTHTLDLGGNVWIVGVQDGSFLKMVKLRVLAAASYKWMETRYMDTQSAAGCLSFFSVDCFAGSKAANIYPLAMSAMRGGSARAPPPVLAC